MAQNNRYAPVLVAGKNTQANLLLATTYPLAVGEIAYATDTNQLYVGSDPATGGSFLRVVTANPSGNVGIGTTAPTYKLESLYAGDSTLLSSFKTYPNSSNTRTDAGTWGYDFTPVTSIVVSQLGRLFIAGNTLDHNIRIWNASTGDVVASGTILVASASDTNGFKWVSITPVTLSPSITYTIAVTEGTDTFKENWDNTNNLTEYIKQYGARYVFTPDTRPNSGSIGTSMFSTPAFKFTTPSAPQIVSEYSATLRTGLMSNSDGSFSLLNIDKPDNTISIMSPFAIGKGQVTAGYSADIGGSLLISPVSIGGKFAIRALNDTSMTGLVGLIRNDGSNVALSASHGLYLNQDSAGNGTFNKGSLTITGVQNVTQLVVKGNATQTANLQEWQNSSGTVLGCVTGSGNVGIGTTAPGAKLSIQENVGFISAATYPGTLQIGANGNGDALNYAGGLEFHVSNAGGGYGWKIAGEDISGSPNLRFMSRSNSATWTDKLYLQSSGNVGIGTTAPAGRLHINGTADDEQLIVEAHSTQTNNIVEIHNSSSSVLISFDGVGGAIFNEQGDASADFRVESDTEANMLYLDANGDTDGALYLGGTTNGIKVNKGGVLTFLGTANISGGATGTFTTADAKTVTVTGGIITSIV